MVCISTIDIQTRLDVQELLSHFSHFLDHDRGISWAELFTTDGVFECVGERYLQGRAELATLPALAKAGGRGGWRHVITAVVIERCNTRKDLMVHAYCPVIDMSHGYAVSTFYDLDLTLRFASRWRISHARATRVVVNADADADSPAARAGAAQPQMVPQMALQ